MTVKDKDETLEERTRRAQTDPDLRAKLLAEAHTTQEKTALDGITKQVTSLDKDGNVLAEDVVQASLAEGVEAFKREIALAVVGVVPAALSAEVEVAKTGSKGDDSATVTIKLSRHQESARMPAARQGTQAK